MVGCSLKEVEKYDRKLKRIRFLETDLVTMPICVSDSVVAQDMKILIERQRKGKYHRQD